MPDEEFQGPSCKLVKRLETVTFETQRQYSSLFGLDLPGLPFVLAYCKRSKTGGGNRFASSIDQTRGKGLFQTDRVNLGMNLHELSPHTHTHTVCSMTIWMGHLAKSVTQAQITQAFEDFGQVKSVDVSAPYC